MATHRIEIVYVEETGQMQITGMPGNPMLAYGILGTVRDLVQKQNTTGFGLVPPPASAIKVVK